MVWSPAVDRPARGGPRFALRESDGRTKRSDCTRRLMAGRVLDALIDRAIFQPKYTDLTALAESKSGLIQRQFGSKRLLLTHIARIAPRRVVDAIGLSPEARAALSERDEKAIAWAVLAGKRLEPGQ
jgi:hypothetical protein